MEDNTTNAMKALTARLFRKDAPAQPESVTATEPGSAERKPAVPREGSNPEPPRDPNEQLRQYIADLFYRA